MQAFPNFSSEWTALSRQYFLSSMPGNFYEYVSGRNNEPIEDLVKGIRAVAAFKKEQGTLKSSSDDKRNPTHAQSVPQRRGGISNIDQNYLPYHQSLTVIQQPAMPSPYLYPYELSPQNAFQAPPPAVNRGGSSSGNRPQQFQNQQSQQPGGQGDIQCFNCLGHGHICRDCPSPRRRGGGRAAQPRPEGPSSRPPNPAHFPPTPLPAP
ncbi:MAG: hypothetical protein GY820_25770, partial [Gammaproteobacteria bacterium]|nr:hypothetical protein [Gammaproteobacteria bacterium]